MIDSILKQIWELPWYKVLIVPIVDCFVLLLGLWPVYLTIFGLFILSDIVEVLSNWRRK